MEQFMDDTDISSLRFDDRDDFNRRPIAEKIITLLKSDIDVSPMVLDGGWGSGKTEFCHKLKNLIGDDNEHIIYIDAFKADHVDEPLLTVLAAVVAKIPVDQKEKLRSIAIPVIREGAKIVGKALVSHVLRQDLGEVADSLNDALKSGTNAAIDATAEGLLKDQEDAEENLVSLRNHLCALAKKKPMIIFVDELDRCRPDYAVKMLETIKHVFGVPNVKFILFTNTKQLRASIDHCYGQHDAQRYLDKFIKYSFNLPDIVPGPSNESLNASLKHFQALIQNNSRLPGENLNQSGYIKLIEQIIRVNNVSLREIETLVRHIDIYVTLQSGGALGGTANYTYSVIALCAIAIFVLEPELAQTIRRKSLDAKSLAKFMGVDNLPSRDEIGFPEAYQRVFCALACDAIHNRDLYLPSGQDEEREFKAFWTAALPAPWNGTHLAICEKAISALSLE
jgi:hypothetical protein